MTDSTQSDVLKKFAAGFFTAFSTLLLLFWTFSEVLVRSRVLEKDNYLQHLSILRGNKSATIALGDSRMANCMIGSHALTNLAYPGSTVVDYINKAEICLQRSRLSKIVIQASPSVLVESSGSRYLEFNIRSVEESGSGIYCLLPNYLPHLFKYWKIFAMGADFPQRTPFLANGGQLMEVNDAPVSQASAPSIGKLLNRTLPAQGCSKGVSAKKYSSLVELLAKHGCQIVLLYPPVHPEYAERIIADSAHAEAVDFFSALAEEHRGVFINHMDMPFDEDCYHDMTHLNAKGAKVYTAYLAGVLGKAALQE